MHPQVAAELEGVAVLLTDRHAWVCCPHVCKHQGRHNLARQPSQILVVPVMTCASSEASGERASIPIGRQMYAYVALLL